MRPDGRGQIGRRTPPRELLRPFLFAAVAYLLLATLLGLTLAVPWLVGREGPFGLRLAHVHFAVVGGATQAMLGSIPFFGVALLATVPPDVRIVRLEWWLANAGTIALGIGFIAEWQPVQLIGGALVFIAVGVAAWTIYRMARRSLIGMRLDLLYYGAAFVFGLLAMLLGLLLITGWGRRWLPYDGLRLAHLHLALIGWVSLTIVGTMHSFFPTILGTQAAGNRLFATTFGLLVGGVLGLAVGLLWSVQLALVGSLAITLAALIFAYQIVTLRLQRPAMGGLAGRHLFAATIYFALVVLAGLATVYWLSIGRTLDERWLVAYGHLGLMGFVVQTLIGAIGQLLPILAGPRGPVAPGVTVSVRYVDWRATVEASAGWQFWLLNGGLILFALALVASPQIPWWPWPAFIGGIAMWTAMVIFALKVSTFFGALRGLR